MLPRHKSLMRRIATIAAIILLLGQTIAAAAFPSRLEATATRRE